MTRRRSRLASTQSARSCATMCTATKPACALDDPGKRAAQGHRSHQRGAERQVRCLRGRVPANLGDKKVIIDPPAAKAHPGQVLAVAGWVHADVGVSVHRGLRPRRGCWPDQVSIQLSHFDFDGWCGGGSSSRPRVDRPTDPERGSTRRCLGKGNKLSQLVRRLIPFCERNYNPIELGPKGTGKSHIYSRVHRTAS